MSLGMMKVNNFSSLPVLGTGGKAELWVFNTVSGYSPTQVQIGLTAVPWSESTTWNSGALSWYTSSIAIGNISSGGYWSAIDVTTGYNMVKSGQIPYYGWYVVPVNTNGQFNFFASAEHSNTEWRPFLKVMVAAVPSAKFLDFPISATLYPQGAYTPGKVISVMDHNMTALYQKDGAITTFTGEQFVASSTYPNTAWAPCYPKAGGTAWSSTLSGIYAGDNSFDSKLGRQMNCLVGVALNYDSHPGYDYRVAAGTSVYAAASGKVVSANGGCVPKGFSEGCAAWGAVGIDTGNGYLYQYLHLGTINVTPGQLVQAGTLIGLSGNTSPPTKKVGYHLHFELLKVKPGFISDYQVTSYVNVDPYGFNTNTGVQDVLGNLTGVQSVCLWKSGCTNP